MIEKNLLTLRQLEETIKTQKEEGGKLSKILVDKGYVKEKELLAALSDISNIPPLNLSKIKINPALFSKELSPQMIQQYHFFPISKIGKTLTVAIDDPLNVFVLDDLKIATNCEIKTVITTSAQLSQAIEKYCQQLSEESLGKVAQDIEELKLELIQGKEEKVDTQELEKLAYETPIIKIINLLLSEAAKDKANDLLIEPLGEKTRVRCRIDGVLKEKRKFPKGMHNALVSRIKVLANLNIAEMRIPQDGRFKAKIESREVDFRVSIIPSNIGEKVALRILDKSALTLDLDKLGFNEQNLSRLKEIVQKPHGMLLVCGPTGTGKTTTLYSILKHIDSPEKNIVTVEDPVEYQLSGINQVTYRQDIGLTFSAALRSILRQDPDIIMIGEIRDYETLDISIKSALTGHLVLATLHTTTASEAITRMIDMGVEPFLISSSLIGIGAQRLVRRICEYCKQEYTLSSEEQKELGLDKNVFFRGKGCDNCENSGYRGRVAIMEFLSLTPEIKELIGKKALDKEVQKEAVKSGMLTLRQDGLAKAEKGITTLEEVLRITVE